MWNMSLFVMTGLLAITCPSLFAQVPHAHQPIGVLPSDVRVTTASEGERWNRLILLATPKVSSGDVSRLSDAMKTAASKCSLTLMATVDQKSSRFSLAEIGVGYSVSIEGRQTTISSSTAADQGVRLGFIERQVLRGNEKRFADVKQIAHTTTLAIFDAPAIYLTSDGHRASVTRHLCWIDPRTGKGATLIWLLQSENAGQGGAPSELPMRLVPWGTLETRKIHVDGQAFVFGVPTETAFGLEELPPGKSIPWTAEAKRIAGKEVYTDQEITALAAAMNAAITAAK
ncbi:MAG: hypothetical protein AAFU85_29945 [Planctomycetota bacterium]